MKSIFRIFGFPLIIILYGFWEGVRALSVNKVTSGAVIRLYTSILGVGFGVLAIIGGIVALLLCYLCARSSHRSQNTLIRLFTLCRRLLPFMMVGLIIFCGLAVVCILFSELAWLVTTVKLHGSSGRVIMFSLFVVGSILWMLFKCILSMRRCFALFKSEDSVIEGRNITVQQAPEFWQWINQLAEQGQVIKPDNIVVGFFDCFYVTANSIILTNGERLTGNTLYFPLTYASLMNQQEIAAVIGHELGHFTGEDTQYSLRFAPLYAGLQNSLDAMANNSRGVSYIDRVVLYPALEMGVWFLRIFHETVRYWSRIREFAADGTGARMASPQALASALLRISALDEVIQPHLQALVTGKIGDGDVLESLFKKAQAHSALDVHPYLEHIQMHPTDSHPTTRLRIEALNVSIDDSLLQQAARPVSTQDYQALMAWFTAESSDVIPQMSQTLTQDITHQREEMRVQLEEQAGLAQGTMTFGLRTKDTWAFLILAIVLNMPGMWILGTQTSGITFVGWFLEGLSVMFILLARRHYRETRHPIYTFTPQGIQCPSVDGIVEWTWIESFQVSEHLESVCIDFYCYSGVPMPTPRKRTTGIRTGQGGVFIMVIPKPLFLIVDNKRVKISPIETIEHFQQYWQSANARAMLSEF